MNKKFIIIATIAITFIALSISTYFMFFFANSATYIRDGKNHLANEDYEDAVISFKKLLKKVRITLPP